MNRKMVFNIFGRLIRIEGVLLLLPAAVSLIYKEYSGALIFAGVALGAAALGTLIRYTVRPDTQVIYAKEGFAVVTITWLGMSLIGALPFVISREIPNFVDAFFETVSGFTTTGASLVTNLPEWQKGMLFWRSFTHWLGGMGVLVFVMALANNISDRTIHIMRAEMPGPVVGKLVPKVRDTAKILYLIYIFLTVSEMIFLCAGGMSLFESAIHSFGTAGTGGFSTRPESIGAFSPYIQWVITAFMLLFGVNFNLYYLVLIKRFKAAVKSSELWVYLGIVVVSTAVMTINIMPIYNDFGDSLRNAAFQSGAIVTTTGYATANFDMWPALSRGLIFVLLFLGGCAGSTAGGLKISRSMLLFKLVVREFKQLLRPRSVNRVTMDGKPVEEETLRSVATYFALYIIATAATFLLICFEPFSLETNLSAAVSCVNNVGPGFGEISPIGSYAGYTAFSKLVLSVAMLLGRLEIFPLIIALSPATWAKKAR
ncbi:MAG: TrkH family potassium uptake protein [Clostridia bacterium]|nr:TrkH family potassium uptake protein [Clostridia bacterium]